MVSLRHWERRGGGVNYINPKQINGWQCLKGCGKGLEIEWLWSPQTSSFDGCLFSLPHIGCPTGTQLLLKVSLPFFPQPLSFFSLLPVTFHLLFQVFLTGFGRPSAAVHTFALLKDGKKDLSKNPRLIKLNFTGSQMTLFPVVIEHRPSNSVEVMKWLVPFCLKFFPLNQHVCQHNCALNNPGCWVYVAIPFRNNFRQICHKQPPSRTVCLHEFHWAIVLWPII